MRVNKGASSKGKLKWAIYSLLYYFNTKNKFILMVGEVTEDPV